MDMLLSELIVEGEAEKTGGVMEEHPPI